MIVREIKNHPELLNDFDWFNDYNDTRLWAIESFPEIVEKLDDGFNKWLKCLKDN